MKTNLILLILILTGALVACNRNKTASDTANVNVDIVHIKNDTLSNIYNHYIRLKDALIKSDQKQASVAATDLAGALSTVKGCENSTQTAKEIGSLNDIKSQRMKFLALSSDIIPMIKNTELTSGSIFILYCPMTNDGNGGYWMSSTKEVMNPYYGDEMLNCGEVKEEIRKN